MNALRQPIVATVLGVAALTGHCGARAQTALAEPLVGFVAARPALVASVVFLLIAGSLGLLFAWLLRRSGASLKPLVWLFGFLFVVAGPQAIVHALDQALASPAETAGAPATTLAPVPWAAVFGPRADPDLMVDGRRAAPGVLDAALESRLSFAADGKTALAARFATPAAAQHALDRYGHFFQFDQVSGSDAQGWTARRYGGSAGWTHVVTAGSELYAWTAPDREVVVAERERVLGPLAGAGSAGKVGQASQPRLAERLEIMLPFTLISLLAAVLWFFKGSAWAARESAQPCAGPTDAGTLRERLLALNRAEGPQRVTANPATGTLTVDWRWGDARWFDHAQLHRLGRATRLVLQIDEGSRTVRVREYWHSFGATLGAADLSAQWQAASGIQFFALERQRVFGVQLDARGQATGALQHTIALDLQQLKAPFVETVTAAGWTWQPLVWNLPRGLRWLG